MIYDASRTRGTMTVEGERRVPAGAPRSADHLDRRGVSGAVQRLLAGLRFKRHAFPACSPQTSATGG